MSVSVGKARALGFLLRFAANPLVAARRLHDRYGPFVRLTYPHATRSRPRRLTVIADAQLYRAILSDPATWRNIKIHLRGLKNHASNRLTHGMTRMAGARHEHYRRLITPVLKRPAVEAMAGTMTAIAVEGVSSWPRDVAVDLRPLTLHLAQRLGASLLFGNDLERALPICRMITEGIEGSWFIPRPAYFRWLRTAPEQERLILEWAAEKKGETDPKDILSILINNPDESGDRPGAEIVGGLTSFIFGAAYDTCQNGLAWALILLTQFPEMARALASAMAPAWRGETLDMERLQLLPLLDGVVKETLRLFPPVPILFRKAIAAGRLGDAEIQRGDRVMISAHVINRDPGIYTDPDRFRPERWEGLKPTPFEYTVFGAGGHMCPGAAFGTQLIKIGLAAVLSRYSIELAASARIDYRSTITLAPHGRVQVVFRDRSQPVTHRRAAGVINRLVELPAAAIA